MPSRADDEYEVGYGRPPRHTRFKKGQSGNPTGKRKGTRSIARRLERFFQTPIAVTDSGKRTRLLPEEILIKKLFTEAAKGNVQATRLLFVLRRELIGPEATALERQEIDFSNIGRKFDEIASRPASAD